MHEITKDIVDACEKVKGKSVLETKTRYRAEWKLLFGFYNEGRVTPLCMDCIPCYPKVFQFVRDKMRETEIENSNESRSQNIV